MSTSYSWEGKGRYGSFRLRMNVWVCTGKTEISWEHVPYLSASAVVIHYKETLYQVYAPYLIWWPAVLKTLPRTCHFYPSCVSNHHQYSSHLPTKGWPGWVGMGDWIHRKMGYLPVSLLTMLSISVISSITTSISRLEPPPIKVK